MEKYLPDCIGSLNRQKFGKEVEVILVDDGSIDNSLQICKKLTDGYNYYKIIRQNNQGVASARESGLNSAVGEYIAWVDPDDFIKDNWYEEIKKILNGDVDLVFFDYMEYHSYYGGKDKHITYGNESRMISKDEFIYELTRNYKIESQLWSKIIKRDLFDYKSFPKNLNVREDYACLTNIAEKISNIYYLSIELYVYRQRNDSLVHVGTLQQWSEGVELAWKRCEKLQGLGCKISFTGLLYDCLNICRCYQITDENAKGNFHYIYKKSMRMIRKHSMNVLFDNRFNIRDKLDFIAINFGVMKRWQMIKRWIKSY